MITISFVLMSQTDQFLKKQEWRQAKDQSRKIFASSSLILVSILWSNFNVILNKFYFTTM